MMHHHTSFTAYIAIMLIALAVVALAVLSSPRLRAPLARLAGCLAGGAVVATAIVTWADMTRHARLASRAPHHSTGLVLRAAFAAITLIAGLLFFTVASIAARSAARRDYGYRLNQLGSRGRW